jgi:UDP-glucose 4-epimerase
MNILVTGAAGYVGSVCAEELLKRNHQVVCYDNLLTGHRESVAPGIAFVEGDVADSARLKKACRKYQVEAVMHFAGSALIDESIRSPDLFYRNNVVASLALLDVLAEMKIRRLIFSSSAAVYGEPKSTPITEEHPTAPVNPYGETKLVIERALAWYHGAYGLNCVALRYFSAAGATAQRGEDHQPETHLLPRLLDAVSACPKAFAIYGDDYPTPDGTCIRDFVHVRDIAQAHILALRHIAKTGFAIYNIGHGKGYSIREVIRTVEKVAGKPVHASVAPRRAGDPATLVASPQRIIRDLGWQPRHSDLVTILKSAWLWRQRHPNGYRGTKRRST